MGCWNSRLVEREETVARCKARKRLMRQVMKARQAFAAAHSMYLTSLRNTGAALLQFATAETNLSPPEPPPSLSPSSWTTISTATSMKQPPPPPVPTPSTWDFWDPFMPTAGRSVDEEEWEETSTDSDVAATASSELAVVMSAKGKDLVGIIQEVDDYFLKAANVGAPLSLLLEANENLQITPGKGYGGGKMFSRLLWTWGSRRAKGNAFRKLREDPIGDSSGSVGARASVSHRSTIERLYTLEKKLYVEVKNVEYLRLEHEKKLARVRKLEIRSADYSMIEKAQKDADKLEIQIPVVSQAIETISAEIIRLRESELYPQLVELVKGLMNMWRSMYEFHQVQTHTVQQLKYLNCIPSTGPTSEIHHQSTLQLELQVLWWHISFCNLMKAHRDYIQSLTSWLRLSLFQVGNSPLRKTMQDFPIYSLCEEWQLAINNAPDKVASQGIKGFLTMIHAIVVQQAQELKQKKRSESALKGLEKKEVQLRSLESKYDPPSPLPEASTGKDPATKKRAKVDAIRAKAEEEKAKYEKSVSMTRELTMNNLQMGLPLIFQGITGFANVCTQAFESVHNQAKTMEDLHSMKMILP